MMVMQHAAMPGNQQGCLCGRAGAPSTGHDAVYQCSCTRQMHEGAYGCTEGKLGCIWGWCCAAGWLGCRLRTPSPSQDLVCEALITTSTSSKRRDRWTHTNTRDYYCSVSHKQLACSISQHQAAAQLIARKHTLVMAAAQRTSLLVNETQAVSPFELSCVAERLIRHLGWWESSLGW